MNGRASRDRGKVPAVTALFWLIKVVATTLGETGGDTVTMTMRLGYLGGTAIFVVVFAAAVAAQIATDRFNKWLYWLVVVATTTLGTTVADFVDRSLGVGYTGGTSIILALLFASLACWRRATGSVDVASITTTRAEVFYWVTILFSQTLGTALGDWVADTGGLGYEGGALVFSTALAIVALIFAATKVSRTALFWVAFVLTRPLGATVGDLLDKPAAHGGLALSRPFASAVLAAIIVLCLLVFRQRSQPRRPPGSLKSVVT